MLNFANNSNAAATEDENALLHVIVELGGRPYGVEAKKVVEMLPLPALTPLPKSPPQVRGVIKLRGKVLKTIDMRMCLGMPTSRDEVGSHVQDLEALRRAHDTWFEQLRACVTADRKFQGDAKDSLHRFQHWHASYKTPTLEVEILLHRFEEHLDAIAKYAELARAKPAEAKAQLDDLEIGHVRPLTALFNETGRLIASVVREIALVVEFDQRRLAVTIDNVLGVEHVQPLSEAGEVVMTIHGLDAVRGMAMRAQGETTLPLLDLAIACGIEELDL